VKDQNKQILIFSIVSCLIFLAGYFTYSGFSNDFDDLGLASGKTTSSAQNGKELCFNHLDTARYFDEPCYEYTSYEKSTGEKGNISDALSKTVVKVSNRGKIHQPLEQGNIKYFPANTSLNIMLETYTVSRLSDTCEQYMVTIESFSTTMEKADRDMTYLKPSASLTKADIFRLKKYLDMSGRGTSASLIKLEDGKYIYQ
jgi:hypothetical protein